MLASFLLQRMRKDTKRRNNSAEKQEESSEKSDVKPGLNDFCRTCMNTKNLRPIFCNSYDEEMTQKLQAVTCLEIKRNDGLSQNICYNCLKIINTTLQFRIKCKQVETVLYGMVNTNIKTEISRRCTNDNQRNEIIVKNIKVEIEVEDCTDNANIVNTEDIQPRNKDERLKNEDDTIKDASIEWDKENSSDEPSSHDGNITDNEHKPKRDRLPPKSSAERQKKYRAKLKLKKLNLPIPEEKKKKVIPPRCRRVCKRREIPGPPYTCEICGKRYMHRYSYLPHVRAHTASCVCEECGKVCATNVALVLHQRARHGLEKIHKCAHCDYSAITHHALSVHERRHNGERPYVCDECGAAFYSKSTLIQHIGIHQPATIQCPYCPKKLRSRRLLSNHRAERHGKRYSFQCPMCPSAYRQRKYIRQHLNRKHHVPTKELPHIVKTPL